MSSYDETRAAEQLETVPIIGLREQRSTAPYLTVQAAVSCVNVHHTLPERKFRIQPFRCLIPAWAHLVLLILPAIAASADVLPSPAATDSSPSEPVASDVSECPILNSTLPYPPDPTTSSDSTVETKGQEADETAIDPISYPTFVLPFPEGLQSNSELADDPILMLAIFVCLPSVLLLLFDLRRDRRKVRALLSEMVAKLDSVATNFPDPTAREAFFPLPNEADPVVPPVLLSNDLIDALFDKFSNFERERPGCENICTLLANVEGEGESRKLILTGFIDEGPHADLSSAHARPDRVYQQVVLEHYQLVHRKTGPIGWSHRHPGEYDRCSEGDRETDLAWVRESNTKELVVAIATKWEGGQFGRVGDHELARGEFKLSFFYMSEATGDEYFPFRPRISPVPYILLHPYFLEMAADDPITVRMEFSPLSSLREFGVAANTLDLEECESPCLVLTHRVFGYSIIAAYLGPDVASRRVFVTEHDQIVEIFAEGADPLPKLIYEFERNYIRSDERSMSPRAIHGRSIRADMSWA